MYILLIEDNQNLAANVGEYLEQRGEIVDYAADGLTGLHLTASNPYDAIVMDLRLPGIDGLTLCRRLRKDAGIVTPVLMLTARDSLQDKISGFQVGADDYLTKPFELPELHMRLQVLVRRQNRTGRHLMVADLVFDLNTLVVRRGDTRLQLTPTGLRLLELLMRASPAVVSRTAVEYSIWGDHPPDSEASLRGHIHQLRSAIDRGFELKLLHTVHSIGYRLAQDDAL